MYFSIKNDKALDVFKSFYSKTCQLSKHKFFELDIYTYDFYLFEITIDISFNKNHAGIEFELGILGRYVYLKIYDNRHWDNLTNNWVE